jgi:magnesium chelatase family protein
LKLERSFPLQRDGLMILKSLIHEEKSGQISITPIEVEVALLPGLPVIHFLGRADAQIKESALRIKSAIKMQGFEFPKARQIIVNLKPNHLKKNSSGLELAVVAAYLAQTKQIELPDNHNKMIFYGELGLNGEVKAPENLSQFLNKINILNQTNKTEFELITGASTQDSISNSYCSLPDLKSLPVPNLVEPNFAQKLKRPQNFDKWNFDLETAKLLTIVSVGKHPLLVAGPQGTGKTSFARIIHSLLPEDAILSGDYEWWPWAHPHHRTPLASLIGGGTDLHGGELSLANEGVLLLDEFLEFKSEVIEALREPMESKKLIINRNGKRKSYDFNAIIIATTNLCPCGKWVPGQSRGDCFFSERRCRSVVEKLSGPILDRFQILHFTQNENKKNRTCSFENIRKQVVHVRHFISKQNRSDENFRLPEPEILENFEVSSHWMDDMASWSDRRRLATLRVARTIADLSTEKKIKNHHWREALNFTLTPYQKLFR